MHELQEHQRLENNDVQGTPGDNGRGRHDQRCQGCCETRLGENTKVKSSIVGIEAKASFIEREEKRLIELEAGLKKAEVVSKERLESLDGKRVLRAIMKAELLKKHGHECNNGHRCEYG